MNKVFKKIAALGCALALSASFTACGLVSLGGNQLDQVAQENGYDNFSAWMGSLEGADGDDGKDLDINDVYAAAKENGYTGSFLEFIKEYFSVDVQENNDTQTIAHNVMSTVSLCCGFKGFSSISQGTGVIIDLDKDSGDALIVTNYHVVYESTVQTNSGISTAIYAYPYGELTAFDMQTLTDEYGIRCTYVGGAMDYDIAVLKVNGNEKIKTSALEEATIGDSDSLTVGEKTFVVGNAEGDGISVTDGVLSVESEYIDMDSIDGKNREVSFRVLRTSAAVNHGNSGGAIFNASGELIGIVNAKNVDEAVENMGYALPINYAMAAVQNILDNNGRLVRAMFGIMVQTTKSVASIDENGRLTLKETCVVAEEASYGYAAYNKLKVGDTLLKITIGGETREITRRYQVNDWLLSVRKGDTVTLTVLRGGAETTVEIPFSTDRYFTYYS